MASVAVVAIKLVRRAAGEADVEIDVAVAVVVAPRRRARFDAVGEADGRRHVLEAPMVLTIEAIRTAAETDELIDVAVVVEVGPGIGHGAARGKQLRLDELECWAAGISARERDNEQ